jgi:hypothetical protein
VLKFASRIALKWLGEIFVYPKRIRVLISRVRMKAI